MTPRAAGCDDGIVVVSYQRDDGLTHHITAARNTVRNNKAEPAQEDSYKTLPISNVIARYNTLVASFVLPDTST